MRDVKHWLLTGVWVAAAARLALAAAAPVPITTGGPYAIHGTVMDDPYPMKRASMPLQGVKVYLEVANNMIMTAQGAVDPGAVIAPTTYLISDSALTSALGAFDFTGKAAGSYRLALSKQNYQPRTVDLMLQADTTLTVALLAAGAHAKVSGTVTATVCPGPGLGAPCRISPVAGCTVTVAFGILGIAQPLTANIAYPLPLGQIFRAVTDSAGTYGIDSVPIESNGEVVSVTASKAGFTATSVDTTLWNTMTRTVNFALQSSTTGIETVRAGAAAAGAPVISYAAKDGTLKLTIGKAQFVSVEAQLVNGQAVANLSVRRYLPAGVYSFTMDSRRIGSTVVVMRVTGESFHAVKRIYLAK